MPVIDFDVLVTTKQITMLLNVLTVGTNSFMRSFTLMGKLQTSSRFILATRTLCSSTKGIMTIGEIHQQMLDLIRKDDVIPMPACPKSITGLKPRTMADSYTEGLIPLQDPKVKVKYHNHVGGLRIGRLLEDLDLIGASCCYRHNLQDPEQKKSPLAMITTTAEQIEVWGGDINTDSSSVKLAGNVSWVGRSSMEVPMTVTLLKDSGEEFKIMKALFVYSARDSNDGSAAVVNPLIATNTEEENIIEMRKSRATQRKAAPSESCWNSPPSIENIQLIHSLFLETMDQESLSLTERRLPPNSVWMDSTKRSNTYPATSDIQNAYGKVFGGYLMRGAVEMAFTTAALFSKRPVRVLRVDDLQFRKPVDAYTLLTFTAEIAYTDGKLMQVRVQIDVNNLTAKFTSNTLYLTLSCDIDVPRVMPKTYGEYLLYIEGRRRFKEATIREPEIETLQ